MSWEHGATGTITGVVTRLFLSPKGTFAAMTVEAPDGRGRRSKIDLRAFSDSIEQVRGVGEGQVVRVTYSPGMEKLTSKDKSPVMVDGREKWIPALTIRACEVEPASAKPAPKATLGSDTDGW